MLVDVVGSLGYDTVAYDVALGSLPDVEAMLVDPSHPGVLTLVRRYREREGELPLICLEHPPPSPEAEELHPIARLEKPFRLPELRQALALADGGGH